MEQKTVIFFGRSGAGKGTQAKLLKEEMNNKDTERKTLYIETGERFRHFMNQDNYTAGLVKATLDKGGLLPVFLPIWIWTQYFVENFTGNENLILDGLTRRIEEAPVLDSAMRYYNRPRPSVLFIKTSREWSKERLLERNRYDDNNADIEARLNWFDESVLPVLDYFKDNSDFYDYHEINGEQTIEEVQRDINKIVFGPDNVK